MTVKGSGLKHANALARRLAEITQKRPNRQRVDARTPLPRVDVVSESLCDDVVSYLSPTLEKHKGCALIDLQPGACLFSRKLHEYLKPKRHVLIEPEDHYYEPFIKPLLDQPGSTYRYVQLNIIHQSSYWDELSRIQQNPNLVAAQPQPLAPDDQTRRQLDPSTLLIGNLVREPRVKTRSHTVDLAPIFLYNMAYHVLANRIIHTHGLVRMLFWLPERYKPHIFSILPWFRSGLQASLDLSLHTSEAASVQSVASLFQARSAVYRRRLNPELLTHISNQEVAANMRELGLVVPNGRELESPLVVLPAEVKDIVPLSPFRMSIDTAESLQQTLHTIRTRIAATTPIIRSRRREDKSMLATLEYPQVPSLVNEYAEATEPNLEWWRTKILVDLAFRMVHVEANFKALEDDSSIDRSTIEKLRDDVLELDGALTKLCESASIRANNALTAIFEDQIAFFLSPRLVNFPERSYEPLRAHSSDFFPQQDLALFDFVPKTREISVPGLASSDDCARFCSTLVTVLFNSRSQSLPQALDKIGVNAGKDLIPMVPAITDARRGGRLNPNHLRVRMVTEEMIEGLVKAFFEWPFRPKSWEVLFSNVSSAEVVEAEVGTGAER